MTFLHLLLYIGTDTLPKEQVLGKDFIGFLAVTPNLVVRTGRRTAVTHSFQGIPELTLAPCRRNTGQNTPYWNQRTSSSRNAGSLGSPKSKPPMSVVHQGMPATAMCSPATI